MLIGALLILTWLVLLIRYPLRAVPISLGAVLGPVAPYASHTASVREKYHGQPSGVVEGVSPAAYRVGPRGKHHPDRERI